MTPRRLVAAAVATAVLFGGATTADAAQAKAQKSPAASSKPAKATKVKAPKPAPKPKSVVTVHPGTVQVVDGEVLTVTLAISGGRDKAARGTERSFTVPATAKVTRDGVVATLVDVQPGDHADVKTVRAGTGPEVVTAVNATSPLAEEEPEGPAE